MSTRAVIARPNGPYDFIGVYHHWGGNPRELGRAIKEEALVYMDHNVLYLLKILIDDHPAGWSNIVGCNWDLPVTNLSAWDRIQWGQRGVAIPPDCFCHRNVEEYRRATRLNSSSSLQVDCEWAYVIDEKDCTMRVLQPRMSVTMNGMVNHSTWVSAGPVVDLMSPDPVDWSVYEKAGK